jgi:hypothetical protein
MSVPLNAAALKVVEALGGDPHSGKCFCPVHDDGQNPSLQVSNGTKHPVVIHCFGGGRDHDKEVVDKLRQMGVWPTSSRLEGDAATPAADQARSEKERRNYALGIWNDLTRCRGDYYASVLEFYLKARGITEVPSAAMFTMPLSWLEGENKRYYAHAHAPGMVLPIRDNTGKFQGIHTTWLDPYCNTKREKQPQR